MRFVLALLVFFAPAAKSAAAESKEVLLEQAIYTEETAGDIEAAIRLYRRIVATSDAERAVTAQALYRLGLCLERRGRKGEARDAFERLVKEFSDQADLVARVRPRLAPRLLPVPWTDGEALYYTHRIADSDRVSAAEELHVALKGTGGGTWRLRRYLHHPTSGRIVTVSASFTEVEVDGETHAPLATVRRDLGGTLEVRYSAGRAQVVNKGATANVDLKGPVFDRLDLARLLRRLPLAEGYTTTLPVFSHTAGVTEARIAVVGRESLTVPAGTFDCFKTTVSVGPVHTEEDVHWISADPHRYPVKHGRTLFHELARIEKYDPKASRSFDDERWGVSVTPGPGWLFVRSTPRPDETSFSVLLVSPDVEVTCTASFEGEISYRWHRDRSPREIADIQIEWRAKQTPTFAVRGQSWNDAPVAGLPAARYVADFSDSRIFRRDVVEYGACVRAQATVVDLACRAERDVFEKRRPEMESLFESVRLP